MILLVFFIVIIAIALSAVVIVVNAIAFSLLHTPKNIKNVFC